MVIRFMSRSMRRKDTADRLESHPSGLNRTDARRLTAREIEHRERMLAPLADVAIVSDVGMLAHLHRLSVAHLPFDRADDPV